MKSGLLASQTASHQHMLFGMKSVHDEWSMMYALGKMRKRLNWLNILSFVEISPPAEAKLQIQRKLATSFAQAKDMLLTITSCAVSEGQHFLSTSTWQPQSLEAQLPSFAERLAIGKRRENHPFKRSQMGLPLQEPTTPRSKTQPSLPAIFKKCCPSFRITSSTTKLS